MTLTKLQIQLDTLREIIQKGAPSPTTLRKFAVEGGLSPVTFRERSITTRPSPGASGYGNTMVALAARRPSAEIAMQGHKLSEASRKIYGGLHLLGIDALEHRGQSFSASQAVFHQSNELLYTHFGISKATFYRAIKQLTKCGLIAHASHYGAWYGLTRSTGTVYAVALKAGHHAVLRREDKVYAWRDLQSDTQKNNTAWALIQSISKRDNERVNLSHLRAWLRCPGRTSGPLTDCFKIDSGKLRDVVYVLPDIDHHKGRSRDELVTRLAQALAAGFLDQANFKFWCSLLYKAADTGHLNTIKHALTRLITDLSEWPGLRSPGALLVARLKTAGVWDELQI